ncbi:hypothetical protein [Nocardia acididurans]|nr:hypothetical protein [Nocardia acididurans]
MIPLIFGSAQVAFDTGSAALGGVVNTGSAALGGLLNTLWTGSFG